MATLDELLREADRAQKKVDGIRERLSHQLTYTQRHTLNLRLRQAEDRLDAIYAQYLRQAPKTPISVFGTRKKPKVTAGLSVRMDLSTDGRYFSNPLPKIPNGKRVWVRAQIDMAQRSPFSTAKTEIPELIRCRWVIPGHWEVLDNYPRAGRIEHVASIPLVITREFHAPTSGSTRGNFGMYADPYQMLDPQLKLPSGATVEILTVTADIEAGTYFVYTRTSNTLSSRAAVAFPAITIAVDDDDQRLIYTDGQVGLNVRYMQSGPQAGKYIIVEQDGITLNEAVGDLAEIL